jgi:tRNA G18 (ribose-2'-O)-methylase SpoU
MIRTILDKCFIQRIDSQIRTIYPKGTVIRSPIRELDDDGKPFQHPNDVRKIEPDPQPLHFPEKAIKKNKHQQFKKHRNHPESVAQTNEAHSFIRDILRYTSKKSLSNKVVLEGERLIADALASGAIITQVYYTHDRYLKAAPKIEELLSNTSIKSQKVKESDVKLVSQVVTPPGIIAVAEKPKNEDIIAKRDILNVMPVSVIADTIKIPGNMGGLIRSVSSAGADQIITSMGCTDPWNPQVLRSGMGSHFRIPILEAFSKDALKQLLPSFESIFYAEAEDRSSDATKGQPYFDVEYFPRPSVKTALFVGGEAFGFSEETRKLLEETGAKKIEIPMSPGSESLNSYVAASIIIFEMRRQFRKTLMID